MVLFGANDVADTAHARIELTLTVTPNSQRPLGRDSLPLVSIIIVNHNGRKYLTACLSSVERLNYPRDKYEAILADNASTDGSVELVRRTFPNVKVIQLERNYGFAFPNNVAAREARGEYLALLNNDTEVDKEWLKELVRGLSADPSIKSVASKILYYDQRKRVNAAGGKLTVIGHGYYEGYGEPDGPVYSRPKFTGFGCGAGVLVERAFFRHIGGFDPEYFAGVEEHELGWRIWTQGYKVYYMPTAIMYHWESGTFGRRAGYVPVKLLLSTRNRLYNLTKNTERFWKGILLSLIFDTGVIIGCLRRGMLAQVEQVFLAYLQYLTRLKVLFKQRSVILQGRRVRDDALIRCGILATFREILVESRRFSRRSREPHYSLWRADGSCLVEDTE